MTLIDKSIIDYIRTAKQEDSDKIFLRWKEPFLKLAEEHLPIREAIKTIAYEILPDDDD